MTGCSVLRSVCSGRSAGLRAAQALLPRDSKRRGAAAAPDGCSEHTGSNVLPKTSLSGSGRAAEPRTVPGHRSGTRRVQRLLSVLLGTSANPHLPPARALAKGSETRRYKAV